MRAEPRKVFVLVKEAPGPDGGNEFQKVMGVYDTIDQVRARVAKIAKANARYPMREVFADRMWRVGPTEDEGFFGMQPVYLRCAEADYHADLATAVSGE